MRPSGNERHAGKLLGVLYAEHAAAVYVYAYAYHLLGTREEAEDVVQVAFLQAHRALLRGEVLVSPRAWLSTVVKRQAFNRWCDRREYPVDDPARDLRVAEPGDAAEQLSQVRAVLLSLPEAQHQAFVLRHWSGLSGKEIAQVLGTSESAAESLLVRARASILEAGPVAAHCVDIRELLAAGAELTRPQAAHVAGCVGCRRAQQRLTRVAAAAVVLGLVPHAHVAQALAATIPGFAAAGSGAGVATGAGLAAKTTGTKIAASLLVSVVAVTAATPLAMHAAHRLHTAWAAPPARSRSAIPVAVMATAATPAGHGLVVTITAQSGSSDATKPAADDGRGGGGARTPTDGGSSQPNGSGDGGGAGDGSQLSSGDGTGGQTGEGAATTGSGDATYTDGSGSTDATSSSGDAQPASLATDGSGGQ
jgi:RNA polymerase sigma factor (sigma-70 family)